MNCSDVEKKVKKFLDDLLVEEEYQEIVSHLDSCSHCRNYVSSLGSISNQIWELANLKVPHDLVQTVLFKLKEKEYVLPTGKKIFSKRFLFWTIAGFFLLSSAVFLIMRWQTKEKLSQDAPVIYMERLPQTEHFTERPTESEIITQQKQQPKTTNFSEDNVEPNFSRLSQPALNVTEQFLPLHWHFRCEHEQAKSQVLEILSDLGSRIDLIEGVLVFYRGKKEKFEQVIERLVLATDIGCLRQDFTSTMPIFANAENKVLVYFEPRKNTNADYLHWHIGFVSSGQKELFRTVIKKTGAVIEKEEESFMIISVNRSDLVVLKQRISATNVTMVEFGALQQIKNQLTSAPVKISIYFLN
ncbi:MAG: zf-HC2 domain-containing protein [Candidatus Omnitrophica bacterium]|nr:zf-HC2 domain-containing protein [Candidatus Omnitrophota bacterium]